jgi:hypothetical protein
MANECTGGDTCSPPPAAITTAATSFGISIPSDIMGCTPPEGGASSSGGTEGGAETGTGTEGGTSEGGSDAPAGG